MDEVVLPVCLGFVVVVVCFEEEWLMVQCERK